ncbi:D-inositol-3-phosphate glycosyltransferase [compost metagenome]
MQDRVYLHTSFIPNDEVGKYFCAADVVVLPYRTATQSGITQVAYHFDLPMIVTRVGGLPELVHDGLVGTVVEPNVAEIVKGIASFYDQNKGSVFRENMKEEKKKYSWDIFGEEIIRLAK